MCQVIHQDVLTNSERFLVELSRHNYVTPTSYLELLGIFSRLIGIKKNELIVAKNRTKTGLNKLLTTADEVAKLQQDLETMRPMLEEAVKEAGTTMVQIAEDTVSY